MRFLKPKTDPDEEIIRRPKSFGAKVLFVIKTIIAIIIAIVIAIAVVAWQLPKTRPFISSVPHLTYDCFSKLTNTVRDPVKRIVITGNILTPTNLVRKQLGISVGQSLWGFSAQKAYDKIQELPLVDTLKVNVDNDTDTIYVEITERKPIALWQSHGKISLINEKGDVIGMPRDPKKAGIDLQEHIPFVVGDDANTLIGPFLKEIKGQKKFLSEAATYSRIGHRRWNITMENGTILMLPEIAPVKTLNRFLKTDAKIHLIEKNPPTIDLRIAGQIIVKKGYGPKSS